MCDVMCAACHTGVMSCVLRVIQVCCLCDVMCAACHTGVLFV